MTQGLYKFERTYLERLKLACEVLLDLADDGQIPDGLAIELQLFKEKVEHRLLQPYCHEPAKPLSRTRPVQPAPPSPYVP